jgi:hypothetical protein
MFFRFFVVNSLPVCLGSLNQRVLFVANISFAKIQDGWIKTEFDADFGSI